MHIHERLHKTLAEWLRFYSTSETMDIINDPHLSDEDVLKRCENDSDLNPFAIKLYRQTLRDFEYKTNRHE